MPCCMSPGWPLSLIFPSCELGRELCASCCVCKRRSEIATKPPSQPLPLCISISASPSLHLHLGISISASPSFSLSLFLHLALYLSTTSYLYTYLSTSTSAPSPVYLYLCASNSNSTSTSPPPTNSTSAALDALDGASECTKKEEVRAYVEAMVTHCNQGHNTHSDICRDFSPCGDGIISWGEECDPGSSDDTEWGACESCNHIRDGYACAEPGVPCDRCELAADIRYNRENADQACPFCLNVRVPGMTPICEVPECSSYKNIVEARACDTKVEAYCSALAAKGESDPGCVDYVRKEYLYGVPRVASNCTYRFHEFELNGKTFKKQEVAIIDCEFVDLTGKRPDTTPLFYHVDPLTGISGAGSQNLEAIRAGLTAIQNQRGWVTREERDGARQREGGENERERKRKTKTKD